jgi:hypothetical protein
LFNPADSAAGDVAYIRGPTDLVLLTNLRVSGGMNCASSRYVVSKLVQAAVSPQGLRPP